MKKNEQNITEALTRWFKRYSRKRKRTGRQILGARRSMQDRTRKSRKESLPAGIGYNFREAG